LWKSAQSRQLIARGSQIVGAEELKKARERREDDAQSDEKTSKDAPNGFFWGDAPSTLRRFGDSITHHTYTT